jgi:site-specific DNA-methyltransferase (adenine-specific)
MISEAVYMDNMKYMGQFPDKFFDLAPVDPPYGIGEDGASNHSRSRLANAKMYKPKGWDNQSPPQEYFNELFRVSKKQIIFGANHFISKMPFDSSSWIVWDKDNGLSDFADCELAWTSFDSAVRKFKFRWSGMLQGNMKDKEKRIHPTQKPVALYDWIYAKFLPEGGKVLDTHLGSGSNRIAADKAGNIDFYSCENDIDYFNDQQKRYKDFKKQLVFTF